MGECKAIQQSDEMFCAACALRWDVNDPDPPRCRRKVVLVGLSGAAGVGKSTAAAYLASAHGYQRMRFATPLKDALRRVLQSAMLDDHTIERMIEGDLKELPHPMLLGKTPRHAMRTLGTEWARNSIGPDLWVNMLRAQIAAAPEGTRIVIEDVRFDNEAAMIRSFGGKVIRIEGRKAVAAGDHASEAGVSPDMTCFNGGTLTEMHRWFDYVLNLV